MSPQLNGGLTAGHPLTIVIALSGFHTMTHPSLCQDLQTLAHISLCRKLQTLAHTSDSLGGGCESVSFSLTFWPPLLHSWRKLLPGTVRRVNCCSQACAQQVTNPMAGMVVLRISVIDAAVDCHQPVQAALLVSCTCRNKSQLPLLSLLLW